MNQLSAIKLHIKKPSRKRLIIITVLVVCLAIGGWFAYTQSSGGDRKERAVVDCATLSIQTTDLLLSKKDQEAYKLLKDASGRCASAPKAEDIAKANPKTEVDTNTINYMHFTANLARAAYFTGDKTAAKQYAQKVLDTNTLMSDYQREQIPGKTGMYIDMQGILHDEELYRLEAGKQPRIPPDQAL